MYKIALSVIIPAYNEEKFLPKSLTAIFNALQAFKNKYKREYEVIVVNNNSTDMTQNIALQYNCKVAFEEIHNIAKVRNKGASVASGEFLCFIDADTIISPNTFIKIYDSLSTYHYCGGGITFKYDRKNIIYDIIYYISFISTLLFKISGVVIYTNRETFFKLQGFNESFYAGEDIDFVIRLKNEAIHNCKKFKNILTLTAITSARKFKLMTFKDYILHYKLLTNKQYRTNVDNCYTWYKLNKRE